MKPKKYNHFADFTVLTVILVTEMRLITVGADGFLLGDVRRKMC
jgi:hypothetical protein